jgi:hypothetical protein
VSQVIIVRDRAGKPVQIPVYSIPEEIRPDNWYENPDWRHRPDRAAFEPIVQKLLSEQPMTRDEVKRLAQYVVDYAAHIAVAVYLFSGRQHIDYYGGLIRRLRQMRDTATRRKHVMRMLQLGLDQGLDFL